MLGSATGELGFLALDEPLEGWEALDRESSGEVFLNGRIDLGEWDGGVGFFEDGGGGGVLWGEFLAVSAPWSVELDEDVVVLAEELVESGGFEDNNVFFLLVAPGAGRDSLRWRVPIEPPRGEGTSCPKSHCALHLRREPDGGDR